jgi:hypothetical protein
MTPESLGPEGQALLEGLADEAAAALEDVRLQRQVLETLRQMLPGAKEHQPRALGEVAQSRLAIPSSPILVPEFAALVRQALRHYWGGDELRASPLLQMRVVRKAMSDNENSPVKALRAVLVQAIATLRPPGARESSADWMLYNLLDMKYVQGLRVREIAHQLAMSERDFYRKQGEALREVTRILMEMEEAETGDGR